MQTFEYDMQGTCARKVVFELDGDTIGRVEFIGGCPGNTIGVARLLEGRKVADALSMLDGVKCGYRPTSCPDQFAQGLKLAMEKIKEE